MNKFQIAVPALATFAMIAGAAAAFADPVFSVAAPGSGMKIEDFKSQLTTFNAADVTDFVGAKTVSVIKYDTAWTGPHAMATSTNMLTDDSQSINLLREALKMNPAAVKLMADNKIAINDVVDITSDGQGNVVIYVS